VAQPEWGAPSVAEVRDGVSDPWPGDPWKIVEQHLFCALDDGRITALDLVCSGFRPDAAGSPTKSVN